MSTQKLKINVAIDLMFLFVMLKKAVWHFVKKVLTIQNPPLFCLTIKQIVL